jgi:hypothetical protein
MYSFSISFKAKVSIIYAVLITSLLQTDVYSQGYTKEYDNLPLGWMKIFKATEKPKPITVDHRTYSTEQLSLANEFIYWMQASYHPKGGIGEVKKTATERLGLYNQHTKSLPQHFGAYSRTYISLRKNAQGNYEPTDGTSWYWRILANHTIGHELQILTTPKQYYFYIYHYFDGTKDAEDKDAANMHGFNNHPNLKKYIHFYMPKNGNLGTGLQYVVILTKDNTMPFVKVTRGEFIQKLEERIPEWYVEEKNKINEDLVRDPKSVPYRLKGLDEMLDRARINLAKLKEKYKTSLQVITEVQPGNISMSDMTSSINSKDWDFFDNPFRQSFPVYKHNSNAVSMSKTATPQWVVISWDAEGVLTSTPSGTHMHQSILNNFNFDYAYNYFFHSEKIKGIPYKPLQSPTYEEKIIPTEKSSAATAMGTDASVLFFEDFSTTPIGKKPVGWLATLNERGKPALVSKAGNEKENWIELTGHNFHTTNFNKLLPQNFTMSFDVCVKKNFHWGTPGLELNLVNKTGLNTYNNNITVKLRPGFDGREGWASGSIKTAARLYYFKETAVPGFSNNKEINRTSVIIKKTGTHLQVFIGNLKIYDELNAVPENFPLNHFYFTEHDQGWPIEEFYITNIKISKH